MSGTELGTPLRAVVFDMDGTLVDSMAAVPQAYVETIRELGGPTVTTEEVLAAFQVGPPVALLSHFLRRPAGAAELDHFHRTFEAAGDGATAFPGVSELIDDLGAAGVRMAVFTGAGRRSAAYLLDRTALADRLPTVVGGDEVGRPKPASDGLRLACERIGVAPADSAYVGDSEVDIGCARGAGAFAIHASWGATRPPSSVPDAVATAPADVLALVGVADPDPTR